MNGRGRDTERGAGEGGGGGGRDMGQVRGGVVRGRQGRS